MLSTWMAQRLAKEYSYAAMRMKGYANLAKQLYYFSVFFGEAQRILNFEWNNDLALIYQVTRTTSYQLMEWGKQENGVLPVDGQVLKQLLNQSASDLADYCQSVADGEEDRQALLPILARLATLSYSASGNGAYLAEKGILKY